MSHFYGDLQGDRGEVTKYGTKNSDISSHTRGWNVGILVRGYYQGEDTFEIFSTGGSNNSSSIKRIAIVRLVDGKVEIEK